MGPSLYNKPDELFNSLVPHLLMLQDELIGCDRRGDKGKGGSMLIAIKSFILDERFEVKDCLILFNLASWKEALNLLKRPSSSPQHVILVM
jgi:hypothetical protein